ncbi:MAG: Fe(3+) ABC transporter substrate-binding protein [Pseudohongiellaceae bacterium]|nr:Fe(3+) ABC transporter substrate-binding protein [Pseudohongiellaceae bacterium]
MLKKLSLLCMAMYCSSVLADEVNIYSARQENLIKPILDVYEERTGTKVNLVTGGADELIQRLQLEGSNSPADIILTVDVGRLYRAKEAGVLQAVDSDTLKSLIPEHYRDSDDQWFGLSLRSRVIIYDKERVSPDELTGYADLADPKWEGKVCVRSSSNIYNQSLVASMVSHNGVEATEEWAKGLVSNFARSPQGGDRDQISAVAIGQCALALSNSYYLAGMIQSSNEAQREAAAAVAVFWPDQEGAGAHMNVSGAGITMASKNKEAAVKLLEFLVSEEAQSWYAETNNEFPVRSDVEASEILRSWGEFKADDIALEELGIHNAEAVRLMDRAGWQ